MKNCSSLLSPALICDHLVIPLKSSRLSYIIVTAKAVDVYLDLRRLTEEHIRVSQCDVTLVRSITQDVSSSNVYPSVIYDTLKYPCLMSGFY